MKSPYTCIALTLDHNLSIIRDVRARHVYFTSLLCQYLLCGMRKARVITSLLYEQLAKDLLLYCVPKKDRDQKAYRAVS